LHPWNTKHTVIFKECLGGYFLYNENELGMSCQAPKWQRKHASVEHTGSCGLMVRELDL